MKKKMWLIMMAVVLIISISVCGNQGTDSGGSNIVSDKKEENNVAVEYDNSTLEGILSGIQAEVDTATALMTSSFEDVNEKVGDTYEEYVANKQELVDWYGTIVEESQELFERIKEKSVEYFKLVSTSLDHEDYDSIDNAMDDFYDAVYDDAMDDYYDAIYDDLMDDVYDTYYDGIVEEGYDVVAYKIYSEEHSECYQSWSNVHSEIYKTWSNAHSEIYGMWSAVNSGFYWENYDVDAIIEEWKKEQEEAEKKVLEEHKEEADTSDDANDVIEETVDSEFKELMDSYEAFFDEYVEFMKEYKDADTDEIMELMDDYVDYMSRYTEMMEKLEDLEEEDMSMAEAMYYAEVSGRISEKLLEIDY